MIHLSDENIQAYLDSKGLIGAEDVESHVVVCSECKEKLESYKELYTQLAIEGNSEFAPGFNQRVLNAIEATKKEPVANWFIYSVSSIAMAALLLIALHLTGIVSINTLSSTAIRALGVVINPITGILSKLTGMLNGSIGLLALAGAAVLIFHLLDQGLVQGKFKKTRHVHSLFVV